MSQVCCLQPYAQRSLSLLSGPSCKQCGMSLTTESVRILVQALIASRLDYCNSVCHRISADDLQALQSVLDAGARLIMWKRKYEHNKATLAAYPSANNIQAVYHCLQVTTVHGAAPSYLTAMCVPVAASTGRRCLRTAARGDLMVPRTSIMYHGVLQSPEHVSGMICHRLCVHHPPHLDRSKTTLFRLAYGM